MFSLLLLREVSLENIICLVIIHALRGYNQWGKIEETLCWLITKFVVFDLINSDSTNWLKENTSPKERCLVLAVVFYKRLQFIHLIAIR
ncbi:hypothetical protein CHI10_04550 [Bacillus sp. 7894-2]|nr:hypothetical protein CHI10_04550 [Bacillus sp. 7894-2]